MGTTYSAKNYNVIVFELYIYGLSVSPISVICIGFKAILTVKSIKVRSANQ